MSFSCLWFRLLVANVFVFFFVYSYILFHCGQLLLSAFVFLISPPIQWHISSREIYSNTVNPGCESV